MIREGIHIVFDFQNDYEKDNTEDILSKIDVELQKGVDSIKAGRTGEAGAVFTDIRKGYNL